MMLFVTTAANPAKFLSDQLLVNLSFVVLVLKAKVGAKGAEDLKAEGLRIDKCLMLPVQIVEMPVKFHSNLPVKNQSFAVIALAIKRMLEETVVAAELIWMKLMLN